MAISKRLRFEVLRRDNHSCRYCGAKAPDVKLVIDHVTPETLGGKTEPGNLVTSCEPCNSGKTSTVPDAPLVGDVAADALRWAKAMEVASIAHRVNRDERDAIRAQFLADWQGWTYESRGERKTIDIPNSWPDTIDQLYAAGLDNEDLKDAVDTAMRRKGVTDEFRYFCGVAWNMLRARQEEAGRLLDDWDVQGGTSLIGSPRALAVLREALLDEGDEDLERWTSRARESSRDRGEEYEGDVPVAAVAAEVVYEQREALWRCEVALTRILERLPADLVAAARATAVADLDRNLPGEHSDRDVLLGTVFNAGEAMGLAAVEVPF